MSRLGDRVLDYKPEASVEGDPLPLSQHQPGPSLKVLMSHAVGLSAFEVHTFDEAADASSFLDDRFRGQAAPGVLAFWALTVEPNEATSVTAEPVVIVRDTGRPGVAFLFSFVDMDGALRYLREELPLRLDLASVELYWAVPVSIGLNDGLFNLSPQTPPAC